MPMGRALRLCPNLIIVSGRHHLYEEASERVMEKLRNLTPLVEQISIDEAFLDISDLRETPARIARDLQAAIKNELQLPSSIGIASNKLVAKIATEVGKKAGMNRAHPAVQPRDEQIGPPFGLTIVPAGEEAAFLAPLPADMLWGVGPKTAARLAELNINTIGDIANWPESDLIRRFGENGRDLAHHSRGQDDRPVVTEHELKSISQEITYSVDIREDKVIEKTLREMSIEVARRLRRNDLVCTTVKLKLRWPDFTTLTRQVTPPQPTDNEDEIIQCALNLLHQVRKPNKAVRLIGVGVSGLGPPIRQLSLWDVSDERSRKLQEIVDALQEKYGRRMITRGNTLEEE
jgi:DNA polymerase-4